MVTCASLLAALLRKPLRFQKLNVDQVDALLSRTQQTLVAAAKELRLTMIQRWDGSSFYLLQTPDSGESVALLPFGSGVDDALAV